MSAIAGVWNRDGRPVAREVFDRMVSALAYRGPDAAASWVDGAVGLGVCTLVTTDEAARERQPVADASGRYRMVWEGRVDNREELGAAIAGKGGRLRDDTDAELAMGAWLAWGEDAPAHILGDFAMAVWDGVDERMYCARDPLGVHPFYYAERPGVFAFASELAAVLEVPGVSNRVNEGMVAEYLTGWFTTVEETLFGDVRRLHPASWISVSREGVRTGRYWRIDGGREIRYGSDGEYAEQFLSLFSEAVRVRLRCRGGVASHLSGGMDSSSVSWMGRQLAGAGFETWSMVYPGMKCDESAQIRAIAEFCGISNRGFAYEAAPADLYEREAGLVRDFPGYPNHRAQEMPMTRYARENGTRVMLTGIGGNQVVEGSYLFLASMVRDGRWGQAIDSARVMGKRWGVSWPGVLAQWGVRPNVPPALRPSYWGYHRLPFPWMREEYLRQSGFWDRLLGYRRRVSAVRGLAPEIREQIEQFHSPVEIHNREIGERANALEGVESRHPFYDRRLVEFVCALPAEQRRTAERSKVVLRNAMAGRLPAATLGRRVQAEFSWLFFEELKRRDWDVGLTGPEMQERLKVAGASEIVKGLRRRYEQGDGVRIRMLPWYWLGISLWFRHGAPQKG